jgi:hypothetical protein
MAYKLTIDESVRDGIRRCAAEQLDRAVAELSERIAEDPGDAVHNARDWAGARCPQRSGDERTGRCVAPPAACPRLATPRR